LTIRIELTNGITLICKGKRRNTIFIIYFI